MPKDQRSIEDEGINHRIMVTLSSYSLLPVVRSVRRMNWYKKRVLPIPCLILILFRIKIDEGPDDNKLPYDDRDFPFEEPDGDTVDR